MPHDALCCQVRCPYYKSHDRAALRCQWLAGGLVTQRFVTSQRRIRHMRRYCAVQDFGRCPLAAVMNLAYAPWLRPGALPLDPAKGTKPLWNPIHGEGAGKNDIRIDEDEAGKDGLEALSLDPTKGPIVEAPPVAP